MSTIRHPVQNHAWWYAAAATAVIIGFLAVLMVNVFSNSGSVGDPAVNVGPVGTPYHGHAYGAPCFAGHPGAPIDLERSGCPAGTP
jgi:hypothetical protein